MKRFLLNFGLCSLLLLKSFQAHADCSLVYTGLVPLPEMGTKTYKTFAGGLYPNGINTPPPTHFQAALTLAQNLKPLAANGNVDTTNGKIVMVSIGMSNTTQEFASKGSGAFVPRMKNDASRNSKLVLIDCAQGGQTANVWADPLSNVWSVVQTRVSQAGCTLAQVQVAWVKHGNGHPANDGAFPLHAQVLKNDMESCLQLMKDDFPNIKLAYFSSRTRAYTNDTATLNPEPYAYECGFATRWLIEDQINGNGNINYDPGQGIVRAPLVLWGPYLWIDGTTPRTDGKTWLCSDLESDFTHPSSSGGVPKVADQLIAFFKTDPTTRPWFMKAPSGMSVTLGANATSGHIPLTVNFTATGATDANQYAWTFGDGTSSLAQNPTKIFRTPGNYTVRLLASNTSTGKSAYVEQEITVIDYQSSAGDVWMKTR